MASSFPGAIDNFTDPLANSSLASPSHAGQHSDLNDAVEKIETYMGLVKVIPTSVSSTGGSAATLSSTGTVTIGAGNTAVSILGCFGSLYQNYRIVATFNGTTDAEMRMQMHDGTGLDTNNVYAWQRLLSDGTSTVAQRSTAQVFGVISFVSADTNSFTADVLLPNVATEGTLWQITNLTRTNTIRIESLNTVYNANKAFTGFGFSITAGSLDSGTIRVYGYRN